jgi:hypothetical protein
VLASAGVEVKTAVASLAERVVACASLAAPGPETSGVESIEEGFVELFESFCSSTAEFFAWAYGGGEEDAVVLFGVAAVAGSIWGVTTEYTRHRMRQRHNVCRGALQERNVDPTTRAVESRVEARRGGTNHTDFLPNKVRRAVVCGRMADNTTLVSIHARHLGNEWDATERCRHHDVLRMQGPGLLVLFVDYHGPVTLLVLIGLDDGRLAPSVEL